MWEETLTDICEGALEVVTERAVPRYQPGARRPMKRRHRMECPETAPILNVRQARRGLHIVRYADEATPEKRAKPIGANGLLLFTAVTRDGCAERSRAVFYRKQTTCPFAIDFTPEFDGLFITYWARWSGPRDEIGPWSEPVTVRIAA